MSQAPYGYNSLNGRPEYVRRLNFYDQLALLSHGPAKIPGYGIVDIDPRTEGRIWVPWDLVYDTDTWTLRSSIHADTFDPLDLPYGWEIVEGGGGSSVSVSGGEILITATPGNAESLVISFPDIGEGALGSKDWLRVIVRGYAKSVTSTLSNSVHVRIQMYTALNEYIYWYWDQSVSRVSQFYGEVAMQSRPAITTTQSMELCVNPSTGNESVTSVRSLSDPLRNIDMTTDEVNWLAPTDKNSLWFKAAASAGGVGNTVMAIESIAIYSGTM